MTDRDPSDDPREAALIARLRALPAEEPPAGWEARVDRRLAAEQARTRRRRWLWAGAAAAALAAAAAGYLVWGRPRARPGDTLSIAVVTPDGTRRARQVSVGDTLRLTGRTERRHGELRVYRDTALVARCPGDPGCRTADGVTTLELTVTAAGPYSVLWLASDHPLPEASTNLDVDLLRATEAGASHRLDDLIVEP